MSNVRTIRSQLPPADNTLSGNLYSEQIISGSVVDTLNVLTGYIYPGHTISGSSNINLIHGFSAYQEAVFRGFEGSLDEWLESLKLNAGDSCDCDRLPDEDIDEVFNLWFNID